jgi:lipoprotein-releasing system permease protein
LYKLHLILKYLRKRRIAWVSLIAVMMCTAMVIVVISVMGGWLAMFRESFHGVNGDIIVTRQSLTGFPYYQEMVDKIGKIPEVNGAAPVLHTFGLINIYGQIFDGVQVVGMPLEQMNGVSKFRESLYRQHDSSAPGFGKPLKDEVYKERLPDAKVDVSKWPGMIVGVGVVGIRKRVDEKTGEQYDTGREALDNGVWAKLTTMGVQEGSTRIDPNLKTERNYWIVDDSRTKIWQVDQNTVYVPFDVLQRDLQMDDQKDETGAVINPARANDIQIGVKSGADLDKISQQVQQIVDQTLAAHGMDYFHDPVISNPWYATQPTAKFLNAVEHEIVLVTFLFGLISIVAIFLIFCIFFMIVVEKTKDIGIIKSVGATSTGVAQIFLGYGLAIGIVGSAMGLLVSYLIVHNINQLHEWLGKFMGIKVWDPETYAFDTIPNTLDPNKVAVILLIGVIASLVGALVPAIRAARMNPVEALRWE